MEEYFWSKEAFVSNVNIKSVVIDGVFSLILFDPLSRVTVILVELLGNVRADVTEPFCKGREGWKKKELICDNCSVGEYVCVINNNNNNNKINIYIK